MKKRLNGIIKKDNFKETSKINNANAISKYFINQIGYPIIYPKAIESAHILLKDAIDYNFIKDYLERLF